MPRTRTRNFLPSTGRLDDATGRRRRGSDDGITVRNDTGVYEGGEISIYYDPMIAKLVTHAPTREAAIDAQADALDAFAIDGIRHNIPFLAGADGASALARRASSRPASSPRNSRTASKPRAARARARACSPRSRPRSTTCSASASGGSPASSPAAR